MYFIMASVMISSVSMAQEFDRELDNQVIMELNELPWSNNGEMIAYGELMMEKSREGEGCFEAIMGGYSLAEVALRQGDLDRAIGILEGGDPCLLQSTSVRYQLGILYFRQSEFAEARKHWRFVAAHSDTDNRPYATQNIGTCFQREGQLDSAQYYYEEALLMQGDDIQLMTLNNIVSTLIDRGRHQDVGAFFEVARRIDVQDSTAMDMLYWNMLSANIILDRETEARSVYMEREDLGFKGIPEYAVDVYWMYLLMLDDYDAFIAHRASLSRDFLDRLHDRAPTFLEDLCDNGSQSEVSHLPLSVKWDIARRGLVLEQTYSKASAPDGSVVILKEKLERMLEERRKLNALLMGAAAFLLLAAGGFYIRKNQQRRTRKHTASRLKFDESDHKSMQIIRDALVEQSNSELAIAQLAELKELLEAKQSDSMQRWLVKSDLSESELRLLELIGKGYSAAECSMLMNCTKSHIYNLRSQIRKKLNLEESESLKSWVMREMGR